MEAAATVDLDALKARDRSAQLALRRVQLPRLTGIARSIVREPNFAEEIAVDVLNDFLFVYVDAIRSASAVGGYLRMATVRRSVRHRERERRQAEPTETLEATSSEPKWLFVDKRLPHCLSRLHERQRTVLQLRFEHGWTNDRIGEELGFSKQYCGRLLRKTLDALRKCIENARRTR